MLHIFSKGIIYSPRFWDHKPMCHYRLYHFTAFTSCVKVLTSTCSNMALAPSLFWSSGTQKPELGLLLQLRPLVWSSGYQGAAGAEAGPRNLAVGSSVMHRSISGVWSEKPSPMSPRISTYSPLWAPLIHECTPLQACAYCQLKGNKAQIWGEKQTNTFPPHFAYLLHGFHVFVCLSFLLTSSSLIL